MAPLMKQVFCGVAIAVLIGAVVLYFTSYMTITHYAMTGFTKSVDGIAMIGETVKEHLVNPFNSVTSSDYWMSTVTVPNIDSVYTTLDPKASLTHSTSAKLTASKKTQKIKMTPTNKAPSSTKKKSQVKVALYDPFYQQSLNSRKASSNSTTERRGCNIPLLNPWDEQILPHIVPKIKSKQPYTCPGANFLFYISESRTDILLNETALKIYKNKTHLIDCQMANQSLGSLSSKWTSIPDIKSGMTIKLPKAANQIFIGCRGKIETRGKKSSKSLSMFTDWKYRQMLLRLTESPEINNRLKKQKQYKRRRLSVLLFINDGISHLMSRRVMNKTYYYLLNEQKAVVFNGYHSVGKNTFPNMSPYLTGYHINELPGEYKKKHFDKLAWPFVWYNFTKHDYVTGYAEDSGYPTFDYIKKGFEHKPTDYYFKGYLGIMRKFGECKANGAHTHQDMLNLLDQFLTLHGSDNYFFWWFLNKLSHYGPIPLYRADNDLYEFFKKHFEKGTFKDTLVIFGSDHGARFGSIRKTRVGQIEERLPLQVHIYPEWFKTEHKDLYDSLLANRESLTTAFDMHELFLDILNETETNKSKRRGINLFREKVPNSRTCAEAGIPPEYCICKELKSVPITDEPVVAAVSQAVRYVNRQLKDYADVCANVTWLKTLSAQMTNGSVKEKNVDQRYFDYLVIFETMPYNAQFESTVRRLNNSKEYKVIGEVVRISLYGDTAYCVDDAVLREYCYCKKQRDPNSIVPKTSTEKVH